MEDRFAFKSYYWSLGTTSFRMANFNLMIERQLQLIDQFWKLPSNANARWNSNQLLQESYYNFLKQENFIEGNAERKDKDAREKTSGLVDIGLLNDERHLTPVGRYLLKISNEGDFETDNFLQIPKDSFVYFLQLLKSYDANLKIRPFVILCKFLKKFGYLTWEEFAYLLPLCIDKESTLDIEDLVEKHRKQTISIDKAIINVFMKMDNYKSALNYFLNISSVDVDVLTQIGMNRKSRAYDAQYYPLYMALKKCYVENDMSDRAIIELFEKSKLKNVATYWRNLLFDSSLKSAIKSNPFAHLRANLFTDCHNERDFKTKFFKQMHLFKAKRSLDDYSDLNRRYFKVTDTVIYSDSIVEFDVLPKAFFDNVDDRFFDLAFKASNNLEELKSLKEISPFLNVDQACILDSLGNLFDVKVSDASQAKTLVYDERYKRFNKLVDEKFTSEKIIHLLQLFKERNDKEIQKLTTDGADAPTLFEYVLAIAWYQISERQGDVLKYMNLSLEADLMPKTHAGGGEADIVYKYPATKDYPKHDLLIEATLADSTNQRRMEMEPVSRHLGEYLCNNNKSNAYCIFLTNFLHLNVISDFRMRINQPYYGNGGGEISGMKISPMETDLLIAILQKNLKYGSLYKMCSDLFESELNPKEWYEELKNRIVNCA